MDCDETVSRIEIEIRLAQLNWLHRRLEIRKEQFRELKESTIAKKIDHIRRMLNSIHKSAPVAISLYRAALPRWSSRRRLRRSTAPQLK
jgi:hypothetical protein